LKKLTKKYKINLNKYKNMIDLKKIINNSKRKMNINNSNINVINFHRKSQDYRFNYLKKDALFKKYD